MALRICRVLELNFLIKSIELNFSHEQFPIHQLIQNLAQCVLVSRDFLTWLGTSLDCNHFRRDQRLNYLAWAVLRLAPFECFLCCRRCVNVRAAAGVDEGFSTASVADPRYPCACDYFDPQYSQQH